MTKAGAPRPDPGAIRIIPRPPFARIPDLASLFSERAARFRSLASGHDLAPYLRFLADLAAVQSVVQDGLPPAAPPPIEALERAARHAMPPLDRAGFAPGPDFARLIDRLAAAAAAIDMPPAARAALDRLIAASDAERATMVGNVLADAIPFDSIAEHALVAAALQVHFARLAAGLDPARLVPVGDGACPACGGPPVTSLIVGWSGAEGTRFCACSLCATLWNVVRAKCTLCGSTKEIVFRSLDGHDGRIKAETCGACHGYVKVLYQQQVPELDPVADDVASLAVDILVRELGFGRGAVNPFLVGY